MERVTFYIGLQDKVSKTELIKYDECLYCKAIADLIYSFQCSFIHYPEMHLGYILFDNKTELYEFTERADEIMTNIETLNNLYEMEV